MNWSTHTHTDRHTPQQQQYQQQQPDEMLKDEPDLDPSAANFKETRMDKEKGAEQKEEQDPMLASTQLVKKAVAEVTAGKNLAKWLRGLTLAPATKIELPEVARWRSVGEVDEIKKAKGPRKLYLDGSGSTPDPRTRRCGWGVA